MYQEPMLERYGTFREVTQGGGDDIEDLYTADGDDDCDLVGPEGSQILCTERDP